MEKNQGCIEIVDVGQLKYVKRDDKGYVVIKDTVRNTLHRPGCDNVNVVYHRRCAIWMRKLCLCMRQLK